MAISVKVRIDPLAVVAAKQALEAAAKGVTPHESTMGVHEEDGRKAKRAYDGREQVETLAEIMTLHEFGGADVPERSWLRSWFDSNMAKLAIGMFQAMREEADGDKSAIRRWVQETHAAWLDWIKTGNNLPALSPYTIRNKLAYGLPSPDVPLVATEQFIENLRAKLDGRTV